MMFSGYPSTRTTFHISHQRVVGVSALMLGVVGAETVQQCLQSRRQALHRLEAVLHVHYNLLATVQHHHHSFTRSVVGRVIIFDEIIDGTVHAVALQLQQKQVESSQQRHCILAAIIVSKGAHQPIVHCEYCSQRFR